MNFLDPFHRFFVHSALNILLEKLEAAVIYSQKPHFISTCNSHICLSKVFFGLLGSQGIILNCPLFNLLSKVYSSIVVLVKLLLQPIKPSVNPLVFLQDPMSQLFLSLWGPSLQGCFCGIPHDNQIISRDKWVLTWDFKQSCIFSHYDIGSLEWS